MKSNAVGKMITWLVILLGVLMLTPGYSDRAWAKEEKAGKETPVKQELKFFSGSPSAGATWYPLSVGITQIFERSIPGLKTSLVPGGGAGGPITVGEGKADSGLVTLTILLNAYDGLPPFKKAYTNSMLVANLYDHFFHLVVLKDSGINKITDLKGKVISPGPKGQFSETCFRELLKVHNINPDKDVKIVSLGFADATESMKDGTVDCFASVSPPNTAVEDLSMARQIKFLDIDDVMVRKFCETLSGFQPTVWPASKLSYKGIDKDVKTVTTPVSIIVRTGLPNDLVYKMAKALAENLKQLDQVSPPMRGFEPKDLSRDLSPKAKFHLGAEKYYKERGWR